MVRQTTVKRAPFGLFANMPFRRAIITVIAHLLLTEITTEIPPPETHP